MQVISMLKQKLIKPEREELLLYVLSKLYEPDQLATDLEIQRDVHRFVKEGNLPLQYSFIETRVADPFSYDLSLDVTRLVARGFLEVVRIDFLENSTKSCYRISDAGRNYARIVGSKLS